MNDREFEELLKETLSEYGAPDATPREEIWRAVQARRRAIVAIPWWRRPITPADLLIGAAAAALLVFAGIMVGRWSTPHVQAPQLVQRQPQLSAPAGPGGEVPVDIGMSRNAESQVLQLAATRYLSRTESFLTRWRAGDPAVESDEKTREWARRSLSDVRLLLDSAPGQEPEMRGLLLDIEVVLAQILQASAESSPADRDRAEKRLNDRAVLPRLRSMIPAGPGAATSQGVPR